MMTQAIDGMSEEEIVQLAAEAAARSRKRGSFYGRRTWRVVIERSLRQIGAEKTREECREVATWQ